MYIVLRSVFVSDDGGLYSGTSLFTTLHFYLYIRFKDCWWR